MNGHKKSGANSTRTYRTIKVAPTTRAIRAALAVSATMLALAGSGTALAGSCIVTGTLEVTCNGVFTDDVTNTVPLVDLVPDLTLVVGDDGATTVDPAVGVYGISSYWGGEATVITYADINTSGADGVHMESDYNGTVMNYGSIYTYANTAGDNGIDVYAQNDATVINGGDITAVNNTGYSVSAVYVVSDGGYATVDNQAGGSISASTYSGTAVGINVDYAAYGANVNNDGDVAASSFTGSATGIEVFTIDGYVAVTNGGTIEAYSLTGTTTGVDVFTVFGDASVTNTGGIYVGGEGYAEGISVFSGFYTASVDNSGTIEVTSYTSNASGINAYGKYADVDNSGDITVSGYNTSTGISAVGLYGANISSTGDITVNVYGIGQDASGIDVQGNGYINIYNGGNISVTSNGDGSGPTTLLPYAEGADGVGISAVSTYSEGGQGLVPTLLYGPFDVNVVNAGDVYVNVAGNGTGMNGATYGTGSVYMDNSGTVEVYAGGSATGIRGVSTSGTVSVYNSGSVIADGYNGAGIGILAQTVVNYGDVLVDNSGVLDAYSKYDDGVGVIAVTVGAYANVSIDNSGTIYASSKYGTAVGIEAVAVGYESDISINQSGAIYASSEYDDAIGMLVQSAGQYGSVTVDLTDTSVIDAYSEYYSAIGAIVIASNSYSPVSFTNGGSITATGYTTAIGLEVITAGAYSDIYFGNSGSVTATSGTSTAGGAILIAAGYDSDITVNNSGDITASSPTAAFGMQIVSAGEYSDVDIDSSGSISAYGYDSVGFGIDAVLGGYESDFSLDNSGSIYAGSYNGYAAGVFVVTGGDYGNIYVNNSGSVTAYAYAGSATGFDLTVSGYESNIDVSSSGSISVESVNDEAIGIYAVNDTDSGYITIDNSGDISAVAYGEAFGIQANGFGYGDTSVYSSGSIYAYSSDDEATGIFAYSYQANVYINNSGTIDAESYLEVYGIDSYVYGDGNIDIVNSGDIDVTSFDDRGEGINAYAYGGGDVNIDNSATINVYTYGNAFGMYGRATGYGDVNATNSGNIYAASSDNTAFGIYAETADGDIYVGNSGNITATAYAGNSFGIYTYANGAGNNVMDNSGSITSNAYGAYGYAVGIRGNTNSSAYGGMYAYNSGSITVYSELAGAQGIYIDSNGYNSTMYVYNSGSIDVTGGNFAYGIHTDQDDAGTSEVISSGSITVYGYNEAAGIFVAGDYSYYSQLTIDNSGSIDVTSGDFDAMGIKANAYNGNYDTVSVSNSGDITVNAAYGDAYGVYVDADGDYVDIVVNNDGTIESNGYGYASGVSIFASGFDSEASVYNAGDIVANSGGFSVGVSTNADYVYVLNNGLIEANGDYYSVAIWSFGTADDDILNYGTINGALWTGYGNDFFYNGDGGEWNPGGQTTTYLGAGDDTIVNYGTINMEDSVIDLGTWAYYGNHFYNYGTINVSGADNVINMGGPQALVPSLNPYAFYNYGVIDFQDGAPNDMLTIIGDFAGDGDINVDVSGLAGVSDILYIDGSVVTGTAGVINVDLLDLPDSIATLIPIVYVSGDSVDGNFVLGDVNWDENNTFVTLDFGIVSDIDASNATPDVFSLGIEVTGLSDPGTLAASLAPSVQSLMNTQVGTWRQRMGVIDSFNKGAVALWARVFTDKGSFEPEHTAGNFGNGGNFNWDQKNSGVEGGVDFSVTDEFSLGLLVSQSKADTHLDDPGSGHAEIDADTWGIYGTWISPNGFYLDASYRWMSFDVDLSSVAGAMETSGDAEAFNIEMGYAWTLEGGLKIEPQLQYTKTNVDNIDVLVTSTGMEFHNEGGDSSRGRLGVAIRKSFGEADNGWLWTPYATLSAVREFDGENSYDINNVFFGKTTVEGTSALLELGFTARHQGWAIYGGLNWQDGGAVNSFFGGQLGVRYTFGGAAPAPAPVAPPAKTCADLDDDGDGVNNCDDKCLGSTAGQAVGPDGCPVPLTIDLKGVNFDFDKATLRPDAVAILDEAVAILGKYPDLKVEVAGHTDSIGTEQYNQGLSERRAQAVYDYLKDHGIDSGRMVGPNGYGETRPIAPNTNEDGSDNPEGRAKNRRTELNVQN